MTMQFRRLILLPILLVVCGQQLHAQIKVEMGFERRLWVLYEPIPVTVAITNLTGHDLTLADANGQSWFSFEVTTNDGRLVPPLDLNYKIPGLRVPTGTTVKHTVNISNMYAVQDIGVYRLRASIYSADAKKYFSSAKDELEVTEAKTFWQQTIGVPENAGVKGTHRTYSLLTFRQPKFNVLYVRVEDRDSNTIYATSSLGPLIASVEPDFKLDRENKLHVLQLVGPRTFLYSSVGLDGACTQLNYYSVATQPQLKKDAEGEVFVSGGQIDAPAGGPGSSGASAGAGGESSGPKISDRPPGFPTPGQ